MAMKATLLVSKEWAREQLQRRIEIGAEMASHVVKNEHEAARGQSYERTWDAYNVELLGQIVDTPRWADEYVNTGGIGTQGEMLTR